MNRTEIAYRKHGEMWKRKTFRTEAQLDRWLDQHDENCAEVRLADDNDAEA